MLTIVPYSSARDEFSGTDGIFLDANENPIKSLVAKGYNRYPDPHQRELKKEVSKIKGVSSGQIFLGNGSDEPIDLLIRAFCEPKQDEIIILPPTYGMYKVCAGIQDIGIKSIPLTADFDLDLEAIKKNISSKTKIIWVCTPNNPTGNSVSSQKITALLSSFHGLVVVDEAYIDFSDKESFISQLEEYPNLVVLHTFSKAWGMAALRLGMCFASEEIISILTKIKFPYNINQATIDLAMLGLQKEKEKDELVTTIISERNRLTKLLANVDCVKHVYPSETNFLLVKVTDAKKIYSDMIKKGIVVRDRSSVAGCEECLRITVGTHEENNSLLALLKAY